MRPWILSVISETESESSNDEFSVPLYKLKSLAFHKKCAART